MVVSVDTRRMASVESVDEQNLMVTVGAGITGKVLEQDLIKEGLPLVTNQTAMSFQLLEVGYLLMLLV